MSSSSQAVGVADARGDVFQDRRLDDRLAGDLAAIFQVLADANRVRMVATLADGELCVGDLSEAVGMSLSAVSHQLRAMRELGVVKSRREGRYVYYALDDEHIEGIYRQGLVHVRHRQETMSQAQGRGVGSSRGDENDG